MDRLDRWLVFVSYVLLIFVVAWTAWSVERQLDEAREERCELILIELTVLDRLGDLPVDMQSDVDSLLEQVC